MFAKGNIRLGLGFAALLLILDQLSKWYMLNVYDLPAKYSVEILPFLNFTMVWNEGISMGFFSDGGDTGRWILVGLTSIVVIFLLRWLSQGTTKPVAYALGAVIGGAVGNIIDRVVHGAVADFIHMHAFNSSFYVFNVADAGISLGVIILLIDGLKSENKSPTRETHD